MSLEGRILVVDDDGSQRELLAGFLREIGAEVKAAPDGPSALEEVRSGFPDVALCDFRMPGMNGRELLREIKAVNPEVEVVILTAYGTVHDAVGCIQDGATDYMLKPLDLDEVEHVVRRALEHRALVHENRELRRRLGDVESLPGIVTAGEVPVPTEDQAWYYTIGGAEPVSIALNPAGAHQVLRTMSRRRLGRPTCRPHVAFLRHPVQGHRPRSPGRSTWSSSFSAPSMTSFTRLSKSFGRSKRTPPGTMYMW